jgi:hypothetical protein
VVFLFAAAVVDASSRIPAQCPQQRITRVFEVLDDQHA